MIDFQLLFYQPGKLVLIRCEHHDIGNNRVGHGQSLEHRKIMIKNVFGHAPLGGRLKLFSCIRI